jgi:Cu(I)/Ag(I) efflux system membrane fusion protein
MSVIIASNSYPAKKFNGKIISLDAILDSKNRTLRAHSVVKDPQNLLKPGMFADVEISIELEEVLSIQVSSVINTGRKKLVYVQISKDRFKPIYVSTGAESDNYVQIIEGLKEGEKVVTEANFLLDSEARMNLSF